MNKRSLVSHGIKLILEKCRNSSRHPDKMNCIELNGYQAAQRKIIKACIRGKSDG